MHCSKTIGICFLSLTILIAGCQPASVAVTQTKVAPPATLPADSTATNVPVEAKPSPTTEVIILETATGVSPTQVAVSTWPVRQPALRPQNAGEEILFSLVKRANENYQYLGVYKVNLTGGVQDQILGEGFQLQAVSPDGNWLLVNQGLNLYVCARDGSDPILISTEFSEQSLAPVLWTTNGENVLWMELAGDQKRIRSADVLTGEMVDAADVFQEQTAAILTSGAENRISWLKGTCNSGNYCRGELLISDLDGTSVTSWGDVINPVMDMSQTQLAFLSQGETDVELKIRLGGSAMEDVILDMDEDIPVDYEWSPDGQTLVVLGQIRSEYSGRNFGNRLLAYRAPEWKPELLAEVGGLNARLTFTGDGQSVVISSTKPLDPEGYAVEVTVLNLADKSMRIVDLGIETRMQDYVFIPRIWE